MPTAIVTLVQKIQSYNQKPIGDPFAIKPEDESQSTGKPKTVHHRPVMIKSLIRKPRKPPVPTVSPSAPFFPYPGVKARHSDIAATYVPEGWYPEMKDPVPRRTHVDYVVANHTPTPGRYYRARSDAQFPHPSLRAVSRTLLLSLKKDHKRLKDHLEYEEITTGGLWDLEDQDGLIECRRKTELKFLVHQAEMDQAKANRVYHVFGGLLGNICEKAGTNVSVHGFKFKVPIVVAACVEEIYRRGMDVPNLFFKPTNRRRMLELIDHYDQLSDEVALPDLRNEDIHAVANLLAYWIKSLAMPFMHRTFLDGMYEWCADASMMRERQFGKKLHTHKRKMKDGTEWSDTDTEAEAESEEDEACPSLPSLNNSAKFARKRHRVLKRNLRNAFAASHPDEVINNRPSHILRRFQMQKELYVLEKPQINHARLIMLLTSPHSFGTMLYLFTFFDSLRDHPSNGVDAKKLSDEFSWKLFAGPNKQVPKDLMYWILTRWDRIVEGFKSSEAKNWDAMKAQEKKRNQASSSSGSRRGSTSSSGTTSDPAPPYQRRRGGSVESDRSDVPSYRSARSPPRSGQASGQSSKTSSRRSSNASVHFEDSPPAPAPVPVPSTSARAPAPAVQPRLHDFNPSAPLCDPTPSPAAVESSNPWEAGNSEYEAEDESEEDDDEFTQPQRDEFDHISSLLHSRSNPRGPGALSVISETSVYSQDSDAEDDAEDDYMDDIVDDYTDESPARPYSDDSRPEVDREGRSAPSATAPCHIDTRYIEAAPHEDDATAIKRQFEAALLERELAQKKLEELTRKFQGAQLR